ncbi:hypothetical protein [Bradyrhizobium sp. WD16]|uniref:hypothetical protein n=1 Tax=Bradyrhizobium sp. WD16 TaxID=1521768 RepID=UPI0020A5196A|nr:hypothetical protein [Bradyrhizobium sp. WD16]
MRKMIETIDATIDDARAESLDFVVQLLEMVRLELVARQYGIKTEELKSFCDHISRSSPSIPRRGGSPRTVSSPHTPAKARRRRRRVAAPPQR